jgi:hypothetical protein
VIALDKAEIGRQPLQKQPFLVKDVAGLSLRAVGQQLLDWHPGGFIITAMAGKDDCGRGEFTSQVTVSRPRQVLQNAIGLSPLAIDDEAGKRSEPRRDAWLKSASGPRQRFFRLCREVTAILRVACSVGLSHVPQFGEIRKSDQCKVIDFAEPFATQLPRPAGIGGPVQGRIGNTQTMVRERRNDPDRAPG